jgi:SAM-dependent methyltransferase
VTFEELMPTVMRWATGAEALAALGVLLDPDAVVPDEVRPALRAVATAAGLDDLEDLAPPQRAMAATFARVYVRHAVELLDAPDRAPGWSYTAPDILDGWGRGSTMVPATIAAAHPDLAAVTSFLDIGTGVGLLAVAAASLWPESRIVGIDVWEASLERARKNVSGAGLDGRITLRQQEVAGLDDTDAFDCAWYPTFFMTDDYVERSLPAVVRAVKPGGWVVLGRLRTMPDPLAEAVLVLRTIRGGGSHIDNKRAAELLEGAGLSSITTFTPPPPGAPELVLGQKTPR